MNCQPAEDQEQERAWFRNLGDAEAQFGYLQRRRIYTVSTIGPEEGAVVAKTTAPQ